MSPVLLLKRPARHHGHSASELRPVELDHFPALQKAVHPVLIEVVPSAVPNFPLGHRPSHWVSEMRAVWILKRPTEQRSLHWSLELLPEVSSKRPAEQTPVHWLLAVAPVEGPNRPAAQALHWLSPLLPLLGS